MLLLKIIYLFFNCNYIIKICVRLCNYIYSSDWQFLSLSKAVHFLHLWKNDSVINLDLWRQTFDLSWLVASINHSGALDFVAGNRRQHEVSSSGLNLGILSTILFRYVRFLSRI